MLICPSCEDEMIILPWGDFACDSCGHTEEGTLMRDPDTRMGALYSIRKSSLTDAQIKSHKKKLTARQKTYTGPNKEFPIWEEDGEWLHMPRHYGLSALGSPDSMETVKGRAVSLIFDGTLVEDQQKSCDEMLRQIRSVGGGILKAPTGTGKTPMALWLFAKLGVLPLVIMHKENMFDDWRTDIRKFYHLEDDEIGIVQGPSIGLTPKTKILLGTIQSLCKRGYPEEFLNTPGVICVDEAQRGAAEKWHNAIRRFPAEYRMGLTATPRRKDGLWKVIEWEVGPVVSEIKETLLTARVVQIHVPVDPFLKHLRSWQNGKMRVNISKLTTWLSKHEGRNQLIINEIAKGVKANRKIIVLTDRREHVELLRDRLTDMGISAAPFYGGLSEEQRTWSRIARVLLATYGYSQEALNIPKLDTLHLATPKTDIEQALGRILRAHPDKKSPVVVDWVDVNVKVALRMARSREKLYNRLGCDVRVVHRNLP